MEKERKIKSMSLIALIVAVLGLTVAFAAMSRTLTINGTANIDTATWDVHFAGVSGKSTTENGVTTITGNVDKTTNAQNAAVVNTAPVIKANASGKAATVIGDYEVTLTKPGDVVTFEFDVVNAGTIDADLTNVSMPTPTITGTGTSAEADAALVSQNLVYTLTYKNGGSAVSASDSATKGLDKSTGTTPSRTMVLTIGYDADADAVPENDVTITGMDITLTYTQR